MKKLLELLKMPLVWYQTRKAYKKRIEELKKRDPFIYK